MTPVEYCISVRGKGERNGLLQRGEATRISVGEGKGDLIEITEEVHDGQPGEGLMSDRWEVNSVAKKSGERLFIASVTKEQQELIYPWSEDVKIKVTHKDDALVQE